MAKLATCPSCTTQLALPELATLSDRARCPRCQDEFLLMETVQFSIPEAEILPPRETESETTTTAIADDEYSPAMLPRETHDDDASESIKMPSIETPTSEPLTASATLSDWEARLKRAIAEDVDDQPQEAEVDLPRFEFRNLKSAESTKVEANAESQDYAVPDEDLYPRKQMSSAPRLDVWSPEDAYSPEKIAAEEEPIFNSFVNKEAEKELFAQSPEVAFNIQTDSATRKKTKRSMARTVASASLGVIGIPLGLYALLWLRGPAGDILHVAQYVPSFMLPTSFSESDFTTPEEQLAQKTADSLVHDSSLGDNAEPAAEETEIADAAPLLRDDPAVAPASAEIPDYQGPRFARVSTQEFSERLTAAQQIASQLGMGDLKSKESVAQKGQAYMVLARLADKSSFLNHPELTPEETTKTLLAKQLFESTLRDINVKRDLPQIALRWWQYAERPSPGILMVGRVERLQTTPAGTVAFVSLDTEPIAPEIPVLVGYAEHREGEQIGIVGSIMATPQEHMPDLEVTTYPIVIASYSFPLVSN